MRESSGDVERTRLAPSPTGALHLGNARTFLATWAMARRRGWRIVLRMEDLDGPRVKRGAEASCLRVLEWLGMDWDEGPVRQSDDLEPYREAMRSLASRGLAFPSRLTRKEVEAASSAPHGTTGETRFTADLRPPLRARAFVDERTNWRLVVEPGGVRFVDAFAGAQSIDPSESVGDFVVWTKRGLPAYQLAVVVDDARQGVTQVVRGDDLLDSAARQALVYRALGLGAPAAQTHLPLVLGPDGRRLAKRHGDTRVAHYMERGAPAERVIGLLAWWCGAQARRAPMDAASFVEAFDLDTMPRGPVTFSEEDDAWLVGS